MLPEVHTGGEKFSPERTIGPSDLTPIERMFVGSTEQIASREIMLTADALSAPVDFVNHVRFLSHIVKDDQTGIYLPPPQVITASLTNMEATGGIIRSGLIVHAQLPPLDAHGRASGEWELALLTRKGEKKVVTDPGLYAQFLAPHTLSESTSSYFSLLPPRERRPFPRLAVPQSARRARG